MALIDLHLHSNKSDGEYAPGKVVRLAAAAGLRVIALTDHDTTDGIGEALAAASAISGATADEAAEGTGATGIAGAENPTGATGIAGAENPTGATGIAGAENPTGATDITETAETIGAIETPGDTETIGTTGAATAFKCLPGIEITTAHAREQHLLGYLMQYDKPSFRNFMKHLSAMRRERACNVLEYLNRRGVPISYEQVRRSSANGDTGDYIGRPQIAGEMVRMGYAGSISEAFHKYLTGEEFRAIPRPKPSAAESIDEIRAAGGVAVLAHPYSLGLRGPEFAKHLEMLKEQGLDGLECHYGTYPPEDTQACVRLADKLGLIVTGGSDFHGPHIKPEVRIATGLNGMLDFDDTAEVERIEAAARARTK